jgi:hypothetical protein
MKKILLLESLGADYSAYMIARGFVELLGVDRVREWPYKHTHNGGRDHYPERCWSPAGDLPGKPGEVIHVTAAGKMGYRESFSGCELWAHQALWRGWKPKTLPGAYVPNDGPVHFMAGLGIPESSDDEIFAMLERGEFALIVLNGARWHGSAALHELQAKFGARLPPVVFCDHEDYPQHRIDFEQAFSPLIYFKRTLLTPPGHPNEYMLGRPRTPVRPLPFSSLWDIPWVPWNERTIDVFCIFGMTQWMRRKCKETTEGVVAQYSGKTVMSALGHALPYPEYLKTLAKSKVVIDQQSYGTDTVRFWEGISAGALVVSDYSLQSDPLMEPGRHFLRYANDLSPNGDQQDFSLLETHLHKVLSDDAYAEQMARSGYDTVRSQHRCRDRAAYIVREVQKLGQPLEGLL